MHMQLLYFSYFLVAIYPRGSTIYNRSRMLSEAENVVDYMPLYYLFAIVPLMLVFSAPGTVASTSTSNYLVYRIHQIDMSNAYFGSRNSIFSLEPIIPTHITDSFVRKCALFKLKDLVRENYDVFMNKVLDESLVSGVLIIFSELSPDFAEDELASLHNIEKKLLTNETSLPIYLVNENEEINRLYKEYTLEKEIKSPNFIDLVNKNIFFDSHQFVITGPQTTVINNAIISSLQAKLIGAGIEDQLPTYAIVSHYDSYSVVPGLSYGADSNASGLVILLELMRIFSKLYSNIKTKPRANLIFFISGGGKLNYFGTKKWLEENLDSSQSNLAFENIQFAMCLESLADSLGNNGLYMYVSKPPKPDSAAAVFWENLSSISKSHYPSINTSMIHKKINLAENHLSWEHERFSLRRISAFTLSSLDTPKSIARRTIVDVYRESYINSLEINTNIIGETIARQLYGSIKDNLLTSESGVSREFIKSLFEYLSHIPRAQQLLLSTNKGSSYTLPNALNTIQAILKKYSNNHVELYHAKVDKKNPEFILYDPTTAKMNIYNMKPAIFDLFITVLILMYLAVFYLAVKNFHYFTYLNKVINLQSIISKFDNHKMKTK